MYRRGLRSERDYCPATVRPRTETNGPIPAVTGSAAAGHHAAAAANASKKSRKTVALGCSPVTTSVPSRRRYGPMLTRHDAAHRVQSCGLAQVTRQHAHVPAEHPAGIQAYSDRMPGQRRTLARGWPRIALSRAGLSPRLPERLTAEDDAIGGPPFAMLVLPSRGSPVREADYA